MRIFLIFIHSINFFYFQAPSGLSGGSSRIVVTTPPPTIARGNSLPGSNSPIYGHDSRANPQLANERFLPRLSNIPPNHRVLVSAFMMS